jgi:hypothetical protein
MSKRGIIATIAILASCTHYAGDEKKAGVTSAALTLAPSTFEIEGDLIHTATNLDWDNAPGFVQKPELHTGNADDSFGQGSKEDSEVPTPVTGSIPPNKSDLARFYIANNQPTLADGGPSGKNFLYLAWVRTNTLGSANMDFELNQSTTLSANGVTPVRTAGDILITYDFDNGGVAVSLAYHVWVETGPKSLCFAANGTPCWGVRNALGANAIGAVNDIPEGQTTLDPIPQPNGEPLPPRTFGEAAINLTDSGITPVGSCRSFASAYLKSRSSTAFTSELKDFIAPTPVNIGTCPSIKLRKVDQSGNALAGATMRLYKDIGPAGFDAGDTPIPRTGTDGSDPSHFLCVTTATSNECSFNLDAFGFGTYIARETVVPSGYTGEADKSVVIDANSPTTVTLTFTNAAKYRVIMMVCRNDGKLHQSTVSFNSQANQSSINATQLPTGVTEAQLCGITQGNFGDFAVGTHNGAAVTIP